MYDIAGDLLVNLEGFRRTEKSRPLLFIAHSLGGIVVKEALRQSHFGESNHNQSRSIFDATCGILFFGTPHGGADPRGLIHHVIEKCMKVLRFTVNEQIVNTLSPSSERLRQLREEFSPLAREQKWIIYSFQEQYGVKVLHGVKVKRPWLIEDFINKVRLLKTEPPA